LERVRWISRVGLWAGLMTLAVGGLMVVAAAVIAGDWYLARQPWIGIGLDLLVLGLALTGAFGVLSVVVERVGWLRLLALPPALFVGLLWWSALVFGLPTTGRGGSVHDVGTILYTLPYAMVIVSLATLLITLPLLIASLRGRPHPDPAESAVAESAVAESALAESAPRSVLVDPANAQEVQPA
jgi:hypothetical protein